MRPTRRQFVQGAGVVGLVLVAGCGRLPGQAQPAGSVSWIGFVSAGPWDLTMLEAFRQGLHEHGYVEGQNVSIEARWADGSEERLREFMADLVRRKVDVIVAAGSPAVAAAMQATTTIPIVMPASVDPVGRGVIASLARPGGNVTGLTEPTELSGKRLELLKETVPALSRVAVFWHPSTPPHAGMLQATEMAAQHLGIQVHAVEARAPDALEGAFDSASSEQAQAVVVLADGEFFSYRARLADLALKSRLPTMYEWREAAEAGGLLTYGTNRTVRYRRAAYYVDRILQGTKPADLPVEQPREFEFVINLTTAQALGLTIPQHVLGQATEVIQ
jgi:putative tryptophan/tyrosine transport system substrate-binding protein